MIHIISGHGCTLWRDGRYYVLGERGYRKVITKAHAETLVTRITGGAMTLRDVELEAA